MSPEGIVSLTSLPLELLKLIIVDPFRRKHHKYIRQTCRRFNAVIEPFLFRTLRISTHIPHWRERLDRQTYLKLDALAKGNTTVGPRVRQLCFDGVTVVLRGIGSTQKPQRDANRYSNSKHEGPTDDDEDEEDKARRSRKNVGRIFGQALNVFPGVTSISWKMSGYSDWANEYIFSWLSQLTSLEKLDIQVNHVNSLPGLEKLKNLQEFSIDAGGECFESEISSQIAIMLEKSIDTLTSLSIFGSAISLVDANDGEELDQPLQCRAVTINTLLNKFISTRHLQLEHLTLSNCAWRINEETLPHFTNLRSLDIHINPDCEDDDAWDDTDESEVGEPVVTVRPKACAFWNGLLHSGIRLASLRASGLDFHLLCYLKSCHGLTKLTLEDINSESQDILDHWAFIFFTQVLPRHAATLEEVHIDSDIRSDWCFGEHNKQYWLKCTKLKRLTLNWDTKGDGSKETLHDLLDMTATSFPYLEEVVIQAPSNSADRYGWGATMSRNFREQTHAITCRALETYKPKKPEGLLGEITIGSLRCRRKGVGGRVQYYV